LGKGVEKKMCGCFCTLHCTRKKGIPWEKRRAPPCTPWILLTVYSEKRRVSPQGGGKSACFGRFGGWWWWGVFFCGGVWGGGGGGGQVGYTGLGWVVPGFKSKSRVTDPRAKRKGKNHSPSVDKGPSVLRILWDHSWENFKKQCNNVFL